MPGDFHFDDEELIDGSHELSIRLTRHTDGSTSLTYELFGAVDGDDAGSPQAQGFARRLMDSFFANSRNQACGEGGDL